MAPDVTSALDPARPADDNLPGGRDEGPGRRGARFGRLAEYAGFVPAAILFGAFFIAPLGLIVCYSFWRVIDYNVVHDWTLDNYQYFFSVGTYVRTLWATIWVSVAAT